MFEEDLEGVGPGVLLEGRERLDAVGVLGLAPHVHLALEHLGLVRQHQGHPVVLAEH